MSRPIKMKLSMDDNGKTETGGFYDGKHTYLGMWDKQTTHCHGFIHGKSLYRLAKSIVRQFEMEWRP